MKYKLTLIDVLVLSTIIAIQSQNATAREEHEGGGAAPQARAAAPQARAAAPQARMSAPAPQMRMPAQQQQRASAPPQQRSFAQPQQRAVQERSFAPQAQQMRPQQMHQGQADRSFSQASRQDATSHSNRNSAMQPAQNQRQHDISNEQSSRQDSHQAASRHNQEANTNNRAASEQRAQSNREIDHNAQGRNELRSANKEESRSADHAVKSGLVRDQQANASHANGDWGASLGKQFAAMTGGGATRGTIDKPNQFANPRHVAAPSAGRNPHFSANRPGRLSYRSGAGNIPRAGRKGLGRAGIVDPGGYIRTPRNGSSGINRNYMQQQLSSMPNYNRDFNNNNRQRNANYRQWPGGWNPGPNAGNLGYYPGYSWNGNNYPGNYYGMEGYSPTPWLFMLNSGAFWQPGMGYADTLPYGYNQPISIAVDEVVPSYDGYGNIIGYNNETFYYNAFWDANTQAYGYYDYSGAFHWTTFPWLNTWIG